METVEGEIIDVTEINNSESNEGSEKPKKCKSCKKGFRTGHILLLLLSFYILFSSIYGTIKLIKGLSHLLGY
jgi:hypothetical protein